MCLLLLISAIVLTACGGGADAPPPLPPPVAPCVIPSAASVSGQTLARVGAYYFDGWAGALDTPHFHGLVSGPYESREPLSGWQDNTACSVEQQLAWAHNSGIDFFVFDWYFKPEQNYGEPLNTALQATHALANRHGMQFAILYVDADPFLVRSPDWAATIDEWMGYFTDPAYVLVNGKPLFIVIDMHAMRDAFGSSAAVVSAFDQLRAAAAAHGFPGVYIVGGFGLPDGTSGQAGYFPELSIAQTDGYDAVTTYNYPYGPPAFDGMLPYSTLSDTGKWIWNQAAAKSPVPFVPIAMSGWDPRPWDEREPLTNYMMWFDRTPEEVAAFVNDSITWAESNPKLRVEPSPTPPMVLIEAWNELGEGSFIVPTVGDSYAYGDAIAAMLATPAARTRSVLAVDESGPLAIERNATGSLKDADGAAISAAAIALTAAAADGPGFYAQYQLTGVSPPGTVQVVVGLRANTEDSGPGVGDLSLYQVSFVQSADGHERVANSTFSAGAQSWDLSGQAQLATSDRDAGQMVNVDVTADQFAALNSAPFDVTSGAPFLLSFFARVAPSSVGSGYFMIIYLNASGEFFRERIPLAAGVMALGSTTSDAAGNYQLSLTPFGTSRVTLEATYAGDAAHWPSYARVAR